MKDYNTIYESLNIDSLLYFRGSDEEIKQAEARTKERAEQLQRVFFAPGFFAAELITGNGSRQILHRSTRDGVLFQLSFINADGLPTMHGNYITTEGAKEEAAHDAAELIRHFTDYNSRHALQLHIISA